MPGACPPSFCCGWSESPAQINSVRQPPIRLAVVGRKAPLRYTLASLPTRFCQAVVGRKAPLRYTTVATGITLQRAVVGRKAPLRYTDPEADCFAEIAVVALRYTYRELVSDVSRLWLVGKPRSDTKSLARCGWSSPAQHSRVCGNGFSCGWSDSSVEVLGRSSGCGWSESPAQSPPVRQSHATLAWQDFSCGWSESPAQIHSAASDDAAVVGRKAPLRYNERYITAPYRCGWSESPAQIHLTPDMLWLVSRYTELADECTLDSAVVGRKAIHS